MNKELFPIPYIVMSRTYEEKQTKSTAMAVTEKKNMSFVALELPWLNNERIVSCIPEGRYKCIKHKSPRFGDSFWVQDVPDRSEILIHLGNYAGSKNPRTGNPDTRGCILPGVAFSDLDNDGICDVTTSGPTMKRLYAMMPDEFTLIIQKAQE